MQKKRFVVLAALGILTAGCYSLEPAGGISPELGTRMAFDINDVGRVALGGSMGPEIDQIEGRLLSRESNDFLIAVSNVRLLRGGEQVWHGEQVHIKSDYINTTYLRKYSPGKTIALSAIGIGAVAAIAGASIIGSGGTDPTPVDTGTHTARRIPRPRKLPPHVLLHPFPPTTP